MSDTAQVRIGPSFFAREFKEYSDWRWAFVREALQNCIDAPGCSHISFSVTKPEDGGTLVVFENDGSPMSEETLRDKLLSIGESGKSFVDGAVGGFGKAKLLLYFAHKSYKIRTGTFEVVGSGGEYTLSRDLPYFHGTRSEVTLAADESGSLLSAVRRFASLAQWSGELTVNSEVVSTSLVKGSPRREFEFGKVYTNHSHKNQLVVRINGVPMFTRWTDHKHCVLLELAGRSDETLTSNRDGLLWKHQRQLDTFVTELSVDRRSALRPMKPKVFHFGGSRFSHKQSVKMESSVNVRELVGVSYVGSMKGGEVAKGGFASMIVRALHTTSVEGTPLGMDEVKPASPGVSQAAVAETKRLSALSQEFIVRNETDMKLPAYYMPDSEEFSTYSRKLATIWGRVMLTLHRILDIEGEFAIGFVFADDSDGEGEVGAQYECGEFGKVYFIAPASVVSKGGSKAFKRSYSLTERDRIIAIAAHEVVHGLGFDQHNQDFANRLTEVMATVMKNRKDFGWCFAG